MSDDAKKAADMVKRFGEILAEITVTKTRRHLLDDLKPLIVGSMRGVHRRYRTALLQEALTRTGYNHDWAIANGYDPIQLEARSIGRWLSRNVDDAEVSDTAGLDAPDAGYGAVKGEQAEPSVALDAGSGAGYGAVKGDQAEPAVALDASYAGSGAGSTKREARREARRNAGDDLDLTGFTEAEIASVMRWEMPADRRRQAGSIRVMKEEAIELEASRALREAEASRRVSEAKAKTLEAFFRQDLDTFTDEDLIEFRERLADDNRITPRVLDDLRRMHPQEQSFRTTLSFPHEDGRKELGLID